MTRARGRAALDALDPGPLGFGSSMLGNLYREVPDADALGAVHAAVAAGVRYFDVAPHYGLGYAETRLGRGLADTPRDGVVISTKVGRVLEPNPSPTGSDLEVGGFAVPDTVRRRFDFTAAGVRASLDSSLERLATDRIDIVYLHDIDDVGPEAPLPEAVRELRQWQVAGRIGAVGVGVNTVPVALRAVRELDLDVVLLAGRWTLLRREGQAVLDECADRGLAVVAAAAYNSGLLARNRPPEGATLDYRAAAPEIVAEVNHLADVCERYGVPLPAAAVQFPLRHPAVISVVLGFASPDEVDEGVQRLSAPIPAELWSELDA